MLVNVSSQDFYCQLFVQLLFHGHKFKVSLEHPLLKLAAYESDPGKRLVVTAIMERTSQKHTESIHVHQTARMQRHHFQLLPETVHPWRDLKLLASV